MTTHGERVIEPAGMEVQCSKRPTSGVYELWTRHSIYRLDEELRCVAVEATDDSTPQIAHHCQGAILTGGYTKAGGRVKAVPSLPPPGGYAIFANLDETVSTTSRVLRVVKNVPSGD